MPFDLSLIAIPALLLIVGGLAGTLAGLFGVGGGIIMVPMLSSGLAMLGTQHDTAMHVAVATSLATIIPTSLMSFRTHMKQGSVDTAILREAVTWIVLGAMAGSFIASQISAKYISLFFVGLCGFMIWHYLAKDHLNVAPSFMPGPIVRGVLCLGIGLFSSIMGIGGGVLGVVMLTAFGLPIHRAVSTAAAFGLIVAVPSTIINALHEVEGFVPFGTIGTIHPLGILLLTPTAMIMARIGARWAHKISAKKLKGAFV
ncbi:MAG: sulfite exporter TauE/SafE family protein, partial [Alphaproteobacteria bacterium]|nr:sulfite exporter TauE/SafE family protein [Alphaproteobacteria bacterium]